MDETGLTASGDMRGRTARVSREHESCRYDLGSDAVAGDVAMFAEGNDAARVCLCLHRAPV